VIAWGALEVPTACEAKVRDDGENPAKASSPIPLKLTGAGAGLLLLFNDNDPVRLPMTVGLKTTLIVQVVPAARVAAQLFVWAKSPEVLIWLMFSAPSPVLVRVTAWAALLVATIWPANVNEEGDRPATGMNPAPERPMLGAPPVKLPCAVTVPLREPSAVGVNVTVSVHEVLGVMDAGQLL